MQRSTLLLTGAVVLAAGAALLGHRGSTAAELRGAPLASSAGQPAAQVERIGGSPDGPITSPSGGSAGANSATAPTKSTKAIAELLDLDRLALSADGSRYEAVLKDGRHAILTLDPKLQAYAEKLLTDARAPRGAIVAMAPDGRILALAGRSQDISTGGKRTERTGKFDWRIATDVWAPAASVFKLVTASALVSAGVSPEGKVCYHGGIRSVMESNLHDSKRDSRCEDLTYGVAHSNNAILGKLAFQHLEPAALTKAAQDLGWTSGVGSELTGTAGAVELPGARDLSFAKAAAGFTGTQLSAVGGALLAATFANEGEQPAPQLVASIEGVSQPAPSRRRMITAAIAKAVGKMMMATCEFGSAARSFRRRDIHVAGKTGTLTRTTPFYMEHSWFVGYAPAEQPEIVVSVILGNAESWHLRGHEAARRLIDRALRPSPKGDAAGTADSCVSGCEKRRERTKRASRKTSRARS